MDRLDLVVVYMLHPELSLLLLCLFYLEGINAVSIVAILVVPVPLHAVYLYSL